MAHTTGTAWPNSHFNVLAAILAWIWPGLGHLRLGERRRGWLIMAGTLFLFLGGLLLGGIDSVDRRNANLWFLAQAGAGPIAFAADFANSALLKSGRVGDLHPLKVSYRRGGSNSPRMVSSYSSLSHVHEYGTLFTALAGLMNVVVILDAISRPPRAVERRGEP